MLVMDEAFDRAWRRVGLALDRIGFTVEDRDRAQGLYFVRYVDPDADNRSPQKGFLSSLAFWRSDDKPAAGGSEYRLRVQGQGDASRVSVLTREGGLDSSDTARRMLGLLQEQLR
jgi:outer membrane protein assembly factor BamC